MHPCALANDTFSKDIQNLLPAEDDRWFSSLCSETSHESLLSLNNPLTVRNEMVRIRFSFSL